MGELQQSVFLVFCALETRSEDESCTKKMFFFCLLTSPKKILKKKGGGGISLGLLKMKKKINFFVEKQNKCLRSNIQSFVSFQICNSIWINLLKWHILKQSRPCL